MAKVIQGLGRDWAWPDADTQCMRVVFESVKDLDRALSYTKQRRTAVQAGGNMGVWPWVLSKKFAKVITLEPDPECYTLMCENLSDRQNIDTYRGGLWHERGLCSMDFNEHERGNNRGAQFVVPSNATEFTPELSYLGKGDSFTLSDLDLLYLDIEGAEMNALKGFAETIDRCRPVIAVEDKHLGMRYGVHKGEIEQWLSKEFGYVVRERPNRDVILTCES